MLLATRKRPGWRTSIVKTIDELHTHFAFASADWIKVTVEASTQLYRAGQWSKKIKQDFKTPFPGAIVNCINETRCSDTTYMKKGAANGIGGHGGALRFQCFIGRDSNHLAVYIVQTNAAYPKCLGEYIHTHGAPNKMFCDNSKAEVSDVVKEIYCNFRITYGNSELYYYQNQKQPNVKSRMQRKRLNSC
jgi:hypothetical protein